MDGSKTSITNPEDGETKTFSFDYSYWSHSTEDAHFATQKTVSDLLRKEFELKTFWQ